MSKKWTPNLSYRQLFSIEFLGICRRRQESQSFLSALPVIENLDVLRDISHCLLPGCVVAVMYQLLFQGAPEAFHGSIIKAVPRAAHR